MTQLNLNIEPYPYQLEGIEKGLEWQRLFIGDEPGLGKTLQSIGIIDTADAYPCLVICPSSLKINWQREWERFTDKKALVLDNGTRTTWPYLLSMKMHAVAIVNYESLRKYFVWDINGGRKSFRLKDVVFCPHIKLFKSIIIDESHRVKDPAAQQTIFTKGLATGKQWCILLSGTPVVNRPEDLVSQLSIMGRLGEFGGKNAFMARYSGEYADLDGLSKRLYASCLIRREKAKVLTQLPDKSRQYIECDITNRKEDQDAENDVIKYLRTYKNADDDKVQRAMRGQIMVQMGILKQIAARGKIHAVADFVHDVIDGGEKLILFAYLKEVVDALKQEFPDAVTVTGSDNVREKQRAVDKFQNDPECKLIILNYKSGGTGLTLTASSRVAFIEFPWTYSDCEQAEDRAHRNGQKNNVNCYYFLGSKTIDRYMYKVIQTKKDIANEVTGTTTQIDEDIVNITMNLFQDRL